MNDALARNTDPETSHAAAASIDVNAREKAVLDVINAAGDAGATAPEIAHKLNLPRDSVSPRIAPLVKRGLVKDSGEQRKSVGRRNCIVWVKA